ncbi:hypothetical protein CY34DRAFT_550083 [Suillus luteus UH-Slu-Lm8-n1]|uniref:Uncharacterized protein n=1 Tax=Suillus luteus UH-Slu-Lm8-n1 TaxID=930992 RepID=A0A0D0AVQ0_9AGAM|nr:hypothetical protein CY34DRAFT_550083 [Suillus luteus UH-Slu-Lm8-n1]
MDCTNAAGYSSVLLMPLRRKCHSSRGWFSFISVCKLSYVVLMTFGIYSHVVYLRSFKTRPWY